MPARRSGKRRSVPRNRRRTTSTRRRTPSAAVRRRRRRTWLAVLVAVVVVAAGYYGDGYQFLEDTLAGPDQDSQGGPVREGDVDRARQQLDGLTVTDWASMRGYSRDRFPHWRTVDDCDVRQTVLSRDGENVTLDDDSCRVRDGTWHSTFDGTTLTDPSEIDIDHVVPLANAWRTGASGWDDDRRADFANDLDRPQLIAVSATSNRAKGDQDPSQWKPPERRYWCQYAHDWVTVKHYWQLSVTADEKEALADMLDTCG